MPYQFVLESCSKYIKYDQMLQEFHPIDLIEKKDLKALYQILLHDLSRDLQFSSFLL